ncbi:hypothetical protein VPH35_127786 [Triticum aestivum]
MSMAHQAAAGGGDTRLRTCSWMAWPSSSPRRVCAATSSASARSARPGMLGRLRSGRRRRHWGVLGNVPLRAALNKIDVGEVLKELQEKDVVPGWSAYSMASIYLSAGLA